MPEIGVELPLRDVYANVESPRPETDDFPKHRTNAPTPAAANQLNVSDPANTISALETAPTLASSNAY